MTESIPAPPDSPPTFIGNQLAHGWQVLATVAICGGIFMIAYAAVQSGLADPVSVFLTAFLATFIKLTWSGKSLKLGYFAASSELLSTLQTDFNKWMLSSPVLRKAAIALVYGLSFLLGKTLITALFVALSSPWLAAGIGALVASAILSPPLVSALMKNVLRK